MILIVTNKTDFSTFQIIEWLESYEEDYIRIVSEDIFRVIDLEISDEKIHAVFKVRDREFTFDEIKKVWYRRGWINLSQFLFQSGIDITFDRSVNSHLDEERNEINNYLWNIFKTKSLNNEKDNDLNKFVVLDACRKIGIKIPPTLVTSSKKSLRQFVSMHRNVVTKNSTPGMTIENEDHYFSGFTEKVTNDLINTLAENFFPTLFQKMIDKSYELRIFYLEGEFFASAIFSQSDAQTMVDFRKYNRDKPNRTPPYELPEPQKKRLCALMNELNLNSGSIDIIVDTSGEYYFLEVNPVGQFGQVSIPCNYQIEKKIAKNLIG